MNKVLAYTVIAILLGSVTMVAPLALLGPDNLTPANSNDDILGASEETAMRNDSLIPAPDGTAQQTEDYGIEDPSTSDSDLEADAAFGLSSMGLMVVPSFLVALGVFVYLKKRAF